MTQRFVALSTTFVTVLIAATILPAKSGNGAPFGARNPRGCTAQQIQAKGVPTAAQLTQVFICEEEGVTPSVSGGQRLTLVTDVKMEVAKGRPFQMSTDAWPDIDPSQMVYPVRGSFNQYRCTALGEITGDPGANCVQYVHANAKGVCFRTTFGEWTCKFTDLNAVTSGKGGPPPAGL